MYFRNLLLFVILILMLSCNKGNKVTPATAKFTTVVYSYFLDQDVIFHNLSENATSYKWDFGDGQTSTDANPIHSYKVGGIYKVSLTAGNFNTYTKTIKIFPGYACYIFKNNTSYPFSNIKVYAISTASLSTLIGSYDELAGGALTDSIFVSSPTIQVLYYPIGLTVPSSVTLPVTKNTFYTWGLY